MLDTHTHTNRTIMICYNKKIEHLQDLTPPCSPLKFSNVLSLVGHKNVSCIVQSCPDGVLVTLCPPAVLPAPAIPLLSAHIWNSGIAPAPPSRSPWGRCWQRRAPAGSARRGPAPVFRVPVFWNAAAVPWSLYGGLPDGEAQQGCFPVPPLHFLV